jgi:hypothetical protein
MDEPELSAEQKEAFDETLKRAGRLEGLIHQEGWSDIRNFYSNKVQAFANGLLLNEKAPIADFEAERQRLIGIREMLGMIDNDITVLVEFRKKENGKQTEGTTKQ